MKKLKIVGITACATGLAHTFIAAEFLEKEAEKRKYDIKIEKQGKELKNQLTEKEIAEADVVIIAADITVQGMERFNGKRIYTTSTKAAIKSTNLIFSKLENYEELEKSSSEAGSGSGLLSGFSGSNLPRWDTKPLQNKFRHLMAGVQKMLPVVIVGGILVGLSFLVDIGITGTGVGSTRPPAKIMGSVGGWLLTKLTPMFLAGFIAKSMVGDKGLVPGFVAGLIATGIFGNFGGLIPDMEVGGTDIYSGNPQMLSDILKSGFLGGIIGGFFAGFSVWLFNNLFYGLRGQFVIAKELIFIPIASSLITALFVIGINFPLGYLMFYLNKGLTNMQDNHIDFILAGILGLCMAVDMGGPFNKTASLVAIAHMVDNGSSVYMASVMAAGMVPPLVIAFSTVIFRKVWSSEEKNAAKVNWILGSFYITEGAIPFASKDPKRVIPVIMFSSMIAAITTSLLQITITAPHGGVFIFPLLKTTLVSSTGLSVAAAIGFYIATIIGSAIIGGIILGIWKNKLQKAKRNVNINLVEAEKFIKAEKARG